MRKHGNELAETFNKKNPEELQDKNLKKRGPKAKPVEEILDLKSKIKQGLLAKMTKTKILEDFNIPRWFYD
jgi:hypothetical protein